MYAGCRCPRCPDDRTLKSSSIEGKEVLSCRRCGGVFVGLELGLRLLAVLKADVPSIDEDDPHIACPVCRAGMRRALPSGVEVRVEVCRRHGVWFENDDLVLVTRAVAKALGKPVPDAVASLRGPLASTLASAGPVPAPASGGTSSLAGDSPGSAWSPTPTTPGGLLHRSPAAPQPQGLAERAGHTALDAVDMGVDVVGEVAGAAIGIVTLPVELSLAIVGGLGELFD